MSAVQARACCNAKTPPPAPPPRRTGGHAYTGTLHALSSMWRTEGLRGMYAGLGPTALSQAPFSALYYMFYTRLQVGVGQCCGGVRCRALSVQTVPPLHACQPRPPALLPRCRLTLRPS